MSLPPESNTEVPAPIVADLQDITSMIQINEGAAILRTVINAKGVRPALSNFDRGEVLGKHTAAVPVILYVLESIPGIKADGRTVVLKPGDVIRFGTRLPHAVCAFEPSKLTLCILDHRKRLKA